MPTENKEKSLIRFLHYVKPYRLWIALAILSGVIRYLIPLVLPWTLKVLVDDFVSPHSTRPHIELHLLMIGLCGLYLVYAIASYLRSYLAGHAGHKIIFDLRYDLYLHIQKMSLGFFDRTQTGAIVSRLTGDIAAAQNFVGSALINTAMDLTCIAVIVVVLFVANWKLALISLSVIPFYAWINFRLTKKIRMKSRQIHHQLQEISGDLHEQFAAISTVQAFTQEEMEARELRKQSEGYLQMVLSNVHLQSVALGITGFLTTIGPVLVLWFGAMEIWRGNLSVGMLMAFYAYLATLYQPIQRLTELNLILTNSLAAMDRIFEVFDQEPDVQDKPGAREMGRVKGDIVFDKVGFSYEGRSPVLNDFSLKIPAGTTVALVGPSGSGKTTVVKLLTRFYDVTAGHIQIDGVDLRDVTMKSLRRQMSIVSQEPVLYSGTIADNLRYGKVEATRDEIIDAAELAFADGFIRALPESYDTPIGERGVRLSGGEKQRIAIARAFLKNSPIIILDEPTSALDSESEKLIKEALNRLLEGRTTVIIAHRFSTIEHADQVVVLEDGRIIEQGRHQDLMVRPGSLYSRLASHQFTSL